MPEKATSPFSQFLELLMVLIVLGIGSIPALSHLDDPFPKNHNGYHLAWFTLLSENMESIGFRETRFMPLLNLEKEEDFKSYLFYASHPVLDVVTRAVVFRSFGVSEWAARLQGFIGCYGAAFLLFLILRRRFRFLPALVAAASIQAMPVFFGLINLSMHHPMTLLFGLVAVNAWDRYRATTSRVGLVALFLSLLLAMNFDWPGYFFAFLIWLTAWGKSSRHKNILIGLPVLVVFCVAWFVFHIEVYVDNVFDVKDIVRISASQFVEDITFQEGALRVGFYSLIGYHPFTLVSVAVSLALAIWNKRLRPWLPLWLGAFSLGALNIVAFPTKAPFHNFWVCYWIPLAGISWGVCADALFGALNEKKSRLAVSIACFALLCGLPYSVAFAEEETKQGQAFKEGAELIRSALPQDEAPIVFTDYANLDTMIMAAYSRTYFHETEIRSPEAFAALPQVIDTQAKHFVALRGRRCFFVVAPPLPGRENEMRPLHEALLKVGKPYAPNVLEITDFIWSR